MYVFVPVWIHGFFYSMVYNLLLSLFILIIRISQIWPVGTPPNWVRCSFDISASLFELSFGHNKIFQVYLVLSLPQPYKQSFLQGVPILFNGEWHLEAQLWAIDRLTVTGVLLL